MKSSLKLSVGIAIVALGIAGAYALADNNTSGITGMHSGILGINRGMMGNGVIGGGMMRSMMNGNFGAAVRNMMRGNRTFDMNQMHLLMHGEYPNVDMNAIHQRMIAGNLTQADITEMQKYCPMLR